MIDLTNAPEGATKFGVIGWMMMQGSTLLRYKNGEWLIIEPSHKNRKIWSKATSKSEMMADIWSGWSIYSNTKPLSELSDKQAAELFNHWRSGGDVEHMNQKNSVWNEVAPPSWSNLAIYRAKQKSERELFVDAAFNTCPIFIDTKYDHEQLLNAMFDAGFKSPKVGE